MKKFFHNLIIIACLAVFIWLYPQEASVSSTLKFVQLSDIHFSITRQNNGYKMLADSKNLLEDAISQINNINGLDFVMITGDGIDEPSVKSAREFFPLINALKYKWFYSLGNHDTTTSGTLTKDYFISLLKEYNQNFTFDRMYYSFKPKDGFKVIVLDGAKNKGISSNGNITDEELIWLDNELKKTKSEAVLIFMHFPLYEPFPSIHHKILNADELYSVLNKYKFPIAIFTGHYHTAKIALKDNILHVSTPALATYPNSFRLISVTNQKNKIIYKFDFIETNLTEVQNQARLMTLGSSIYYGEEKDRNTTVIMDK